MPPMHLAIGSRVPHGKDPPTAGGSKYRAGVARRARQFACTAINHLGRLHYDIIKCFFSCSPDTHAAGESSERVLRAIS